MTTNNIILEPVDGNVYAYQISAHEGLVYVTVAGPDEDKPMIIAFDLNDLDTLKDARRELKRGVTEPDPGTVLSILAGSRSDRFVYDRVEYRLTDGKWVAWGRVDIEDDLLGENDK